MSDCGIYSIESPSGRFYIGASRNLKKRIQSHMNGHTHNAELDRDMEKIGRENFAYDILLTCPEDELYTHEKEVIDDYRKHGYSLYNYKASKADRPINVSTDVFRELKKIRFELSSIDPDGRIVTFNEVIKELLKR